MDLQGVGRPEGSFPEVHPEALPAASQGGRLHPEERLREDRGEGRHQEAEAVTAEVGELYASWASSRCSWGCRPAGGRS